MRVTRDRGVAEVHVINVSIVLIVRNAMYILQYFDRSALCPVVTLHVESSRKIRQKVTYIHSKSQPAKKTTYF